MPKSIGLKPPHLKLTKMGDDARRAEPPVTWPRLNSEHTAMLVASGISEQVAREREYRTVVDPTELREHGFSKSQARPGLLIPLYDVSGQPAGFQLRRDDPRVRGNGKPIKYETPSGQRNVLDALPSMRNHIGDPTVPIWITEGVKKADSLTSRGELAISLTGVWNWRGTNAQGGTTALTDWESVALKGRVVRITFDSDFRHNRQVRLAAIRLAKFLTNRGALVVLIELPDLDDGSKQGVDDYLAAGHTLDDVLGCVVDHFSVVVRDGDRPGILVGSTQLRDQSGESVAALEETNIPPALFVRGGRLVRVRPDEDGRSLVESLTENSLRHRLTETADFFRETKDDVRPVAPPLDVVRDILAWTEWPFPPLRGIIGAPALRQDGTVILTPGYDAETRVFYVPDSGLEELQPISDHPSVEEIENARDGLLDLLTNFPFVDNASKANAIGLILTPFLRPAFDGPIPLALIDAPQPGTGKDLLGDVVGTLATGGSIPSMTAPSREDEWRKQITATLKAGQPVVKIGNVDRELKSSELAAVLTTERWEARELGFSHNVVLENRATWIATGNNIKVGNDMGRRCFRISLDPRSSQPWKRTGFKYPNLLEHIRQHRAIYVGHALTLCRAWFAAGRPPGDAPVIGSYESWCRTLGGILTHAGVAGFLTNLDAFYADADEETTEWVGWLDAWPIEPMTGAQLHDKLQGSGELADTMPSAVAAAMEKTSQGAKIALGKVLKSRAGRRYREDGLRVIPAPPDTHRKTNRWQVIKDDLGPLPADFTIDAESAGS